MAGTLKVGFEVDISTAKQQGQKAGAEFGKGVDSGLATSTEGAFSKALQNRVSMAGFSRNRTEAAKRWGLNKTGLDDFFKYSGAKPPILNKSVSTTSGAFTKLIGRLLATGLALKALKTAAAEFSKVLEFSHALYAKSLTNGTSLSFTATRQFSADAMGVSEKDVFRFKQSADVMKQLSGAVAEISKDAPALAFTKTQFKILEINLISLGSNIASFLLPPLNSFILLIDKIAETINGFLNSKVGKIIFGAVVNGFSSSVFGSSSGNVFSTAMAGKSGTFGQPQTFMRQMQAGAFEKMGLVVGSGGKMIDYARRTAVAVEKIAKATPGKGNSMPRGYLSVFNPISNMP